MDLGQHAHYANPEDCRSVSEQHRPPAVEPPTSTEQRRTTGIPSGCTTGAAPQRLSAISEVNDLRLVVERNQQLREVPCIRTLATYPLEQAHYCMFTSVRICAHTTWSIAFAAVLLGTWIIFWGGTSSLSAPERARGLKIPTASFMIQCIKCGILWASCSRRTESCESDTINYHWESAGDAYAMRWWWPGLNRSLVMGMEVGRNLTFYRLGAY